MSGIPFDELESQNAYNRAILELVEGVVEDHGYEDVVPAVEVADEAVGRCTWFKSREQMLSVLLWSNNNYEEWTDYVLERNDDPAEYLAAMVEAAVYRDAKNVAEYIVIPRNQ